MILHYNHINDYNIIMMKVKIFVSKPEGGWNEIEIPENYKNYSYQALVCVAHRFVKGCAYRSMLITENPEPFSI